VKKPLKTSSKMPSNKNSKSSKPKAKEAKQASAVKKPNKPANVKATPAKAGTAKVVKPAVKASAKPVAKVATKSASKPVVKSASKSAPKSAPKGAVKAVVKTPAKTVAKTVVKAPAKALSKAPVKVASKVVEKSTVKAKATVNASVKAPAKSAAKPVKAAAKPAKSLPAETSKAVQAAADLAPNDTAAASTPDVPVRAVRPSARLAQITVPSMAQSVASTAAKASYLKNMPSEALTPPPFVAIKKDAKLANNWKTKKPEELTDAEVMAMSDNDYMNDAQMAFFRLKLVALKVGILASAGQTTENLREDTVVVPDPADRATIEEEHALELRTRDRERKLLRKIEQSIQRIDAGDYGYCDETGEPIGVGRLLARPTANLSLEAQQRRELKQKMFGD